MQPTDVETPTRPRPVSNAGATFACCITGMHRSGTSLVARLLHECGIVLGPEGDLKKRAADNLDGYFENRSFVRLNDTIINQFGGRWNQPPRFPAGWEFSPEANALMARAEKLVSEFRHDGWGWKDPRTSLTLPFWRRLLPELKVIICVRNPIEVARSLFLRGDTKSTSQFELWLTYYRQLLAATSPANSIVTHYESYFADASAEVRRILDWLGVEAAPETIEQACTHISSHLRHHYVTTAEAIGTDVPDEILNSYLELCAEAGPIYRQARKHELDEPALGAARANEIRALLNELQQTRTAAAKREQLLNEILNSKAFKLVNLYWRMRRRK